MSHRVSFVISQIAADAIGLDVDGGPRGLDGITAWHRNNVCYVTATRRDAERVIDLLRRCATKSPSSPELLIECSCAIQAIYEVHDPRLAPTDN